MGGQKHSLEHASDEFVVAAPANLHLHLHHDGGDDGHDDGGDGGDDNNMIIWWWLWCRQEQCYGANEIEFW